MATEISALHEQGKWKLYSNDLSGGASNTELSDLNFTVFEFCLPESMDRC